ncbi:MAG: helix-turn-helix transcriptional regulator [Clostridiales bacterium]|nr:helix-turn-helix transcriptional regulator [Clostridiales bacterium]
MPDLFEKHRDDMTHTAVWRSNLLRYLPHYHSGVELAYLVDGSTNAVIGGKSVKAEAGQVLISGSYTVHSYHDDNMTAIVAIIPPVETPSIQKKLLTGIFQTPVLTDEDGTIKTLMGMLLQNQDDAIIRKGLSYSILGYVMKKAGFAPAGSGIKSGMMSDVLRYLSENYTQNINVESIATHFGYSRSRFSHLFKANIGVSIPRFVNILRCRDAVKALMETDLPVVDVAINAGFNNTHTFYVAFKELYGMTPGEYVKSRQEKNAD